MLLNTDSRDQECVSLYVFIVLDWRTIALAIKHHTAWVIPVNVTQVGIHNIKICSTRWPHNMVKKASTIQDMHVSRRHLTTSVDLLCEFLCQCWFVHFLKARFLEQCIQYAGELMLEARLGVSRVCRDNQHWSKHDVSSTTIWLDPVFTFLVNSDSVCVWYCLLYWNTVNALSSMLTIILWPTSSAVSHVILSSPPATTPVPT